MIPSQATVEVCDRCAFCCWPRTSTASLVMPSGRRAEKSPTCKRRLAAHCATMPGTPAFAAATRCTGWGHIRRCGCGALHGDQRCNGRPLDRDGLLVSDGTCSPPAPVCRSLGKRPNQIRHGSGQRPRPFCPRDLTGTRTLVCLAAAGPIAYRRWGHDQENKRNQTIDLQEFKTTTFSQSSDATTFSARVRR
jgi:hypothetical protein